MFPGFISSEFFIQVSDVAQVANALYRLEIKITIASRLLHLHPGLSLVTHSHAMFLFRYLCDELLRRSSCHCYGGKNEFQVNPLENRYASYSCIQL